MTRAAGIPGVVAELQARLDALPAEMGHRRVFIDTYRRTTEAVAAAVERGFGTPEASALKELVAGRDEAILEELPAGSMRPKVEAAFAFVRATGGEALITSADALRNGEAGTTVLPASPS